MGRFPLLANIDPVLAWDAASSPGHCLEPLVWNPFSAIIADAEVAAIEPLQRSVDQFQFAQVHPVLPNRDKLIVHEGSLILHRNTARKDKDIPIVLVPTHDSCTLCHEGRTVFRSLINTVCRVSHNSFCKARIGPDTFGSRFDHGNRITACSMQRWRTPDAGKLSPLCPFGQQATHVARQTTCVLALRLVR